MKTGVLTSHLAAPAAQPTCPSKQAADAEKVKRTCQDFESILLYHMLCSMRKAFESEEDLEGGFGGDLFKSMMDEQMSVALARSGGIGLSGLMAKGLGLDAEAAAPNLTPPRIPERALEKPGESPVSGTEMPGASPAQTRMAPAKRDEAQAVQNQAEAAQAGASSISPGYVAPASPAVNGIEKRTVADRITQIKSILKPYESTIRAAATVFGLNADLLRAVIINESGGNPHAVSSKGAKGLMQLTDATAQALGVANPFNPVQNIFGGARLLEKLLKMFGGDLKLALASYNAGSGAVMKYGGIPPYKETQDYVKKVIESLQHMNVDSDNTG